MVLLDLIYKHRNYEKDILPFVRNGIILDTSVMKIFINGFISAKFSNKCIHEYEELINFFHKIRVIDEEKMQWGKFLITPHIFTEICSHINIDYRQQRNYKQIVEQLIPLLKEIKELGIKKEDILNHVDLKNPIIEVGDISIFLTIEDFNNEDEKVAVLEKDDKFLEDFGDSKNKKVMVMHFDKIMSDMPKL